MNALKSDLLDAYLMNTLQIKLALLETSESLEATPVKNLVQILNRRYSILTFE